MKKLLLSLGALASVAAPIAAVVSCGSNSTDGAWTKERDAKVAELIQDFTNGDSSPAKVALYHDLKAAKSEKDVADALIVFNASSQGTTLSWETQRDSKVKAMEESFKTHTVSNAETAVLNKLKAAKTQEEFNAASGIKGEGVATKVTDTKTSSLDIKVFDDKAIEELKGLLFGDDKPFTNVAKEYLGKTVNGKFTFDTKPEVKTITTTQVLPGGENLSTQVTGILVTVNKDHLFVDTAKLNDAYLAKKAIAADKEMDLEGAQSKLVTSYTDAQKKLIEEKKALQQIWDNDDLRASDPSLTGDALTADRALANTEYLARDDKEGKAVAAKESELPASYSDAQKALAQKIVDAQDEKNKADAASNAAYQAFLQAKATWASNPSTKFANTKVGDYQFEKGQKIFLTISNVAQRATGPKMMLATSQLDANNKVLPGVPLAMQGATGEEALANFILPVTNSISNSNIVTTIDIDKDDRGEWLDKNFFVKTRKDIIDKSFKPGQKVNVIIKGISYQLNVDYLAASDLSGSAFNSGQSKQTAWHNSFQSDVLRNILYLFKKDFPSVDVTPLLKSAFLREKDTKNEGPSFASKVKDVFAESNDIRAFAFIPMYKPDLVIPGWMQNPVTMKIDITDKRSSDAAELGAFYDKYRKLLQERKTPVQLILTYNGDTVSYTAPVDPKNAIQPDGMWEHYMTLLENLCNKPSIADLIQGI